MIINILIDLYNSSNLEYYLLGDQNEAAFR